MTSLPDFTTDINGNPISYDGNPNLKKANVELPLTQEHVTEFIACKNDILYFAENYFYIISLDEGKTKVSLWDFQREMLLNFQNNRFNIVLASRQIGKTTTYTIFFLWYALFHSDQSMAILANKESTAIEILSRIKTAYEMLPKWLQQGIVTYNRKSIELENGSKIITSSTSSSAIRGMSINVLALDEFAFIPTNVYNEFISSVYPVISSSKNSKIIVVSTPNGKNHFYKMWRDAEKSENTFKPYKVLWHQVPGRDDKWKEETIANIGTERFDQEYNCLFTSTLESTLLDRELLDSLEEQTPLENPKLFSNITVSEYIPKFTSIYEEPIPGHVYTLGVDSSRMSSVHTSSDAISIDVLDISKYPIKQVAKFYVDDGNLFDYLDSPEVIYNLGMYYNEALVLIENNDIGEEIANILRLDFEYPNIYSSDPSFRHLGFRTSTKSKRLGVTTLKSLLKKQKLILVDYETIFQLSTFIKYPNGSYKAKFGFYDDAVMSLIAGLYFLQDPMYKDTVSDPERLKRLMTIKAQESELEGIKDLVAIDKVLEAEEAPNWLLSRSNL